MKSIILILLTIIMLPRLTIGQAYKGQIEYSKVPGTSPHYQGEYTFDTTLNPAAWNKQAKGLHVSFVSTDDLYFRSEVPELQTESLSWQATGWKGERLNAQALIWSPDTLKQLRVRLKDLKNENGIILNKNNITVRLVRYVISNYPYGAKDATCGGTSYKSLYLMPDRFESFASFDLPGKTTRPVWFSFNIPSQVPPGKYTGIIEVNAENCNTKLNVTLTVQNQVLPKPHEWKYRLDLWQNPWVVAWYNNIQPWSEEHLLLLKKHLRLYADAGGKYITTYAVNSPWSDNSYWNEGGMINWIKKVDGTWIFDYSIFDKYVQLAMSAGIDQAITIYTPVPGGYRFNYFDEKKGNNVYVSWPPNSKDFEDSWNIFLTDLKKHLEKKGWFDKTYIGINENPLEETLSAIRVIKAHSKKWKITYAGDWHKELENLLDDYCFLYGNESGVDIVKQRAAKGFTTTYYVCCNPPVPNNFVFSPPIEARWQGWYSVAHSYDGFLRWAYDAWPGDPLRDARHESWPAGDCFLVYPGANSCIRFEKLREGIVEYEKIRILREKVATSQNKDVHQLMMQLDEHLKKFLGEKDFSGDKLKADIYRGKKLVEEISDKMPHGF
ncbi:MAG: glycoside hydrolase domain-containing protein [Ginsengibacter sp.]